MAVSLGLKQAVYRLRPATPDDEDLLFRLFAESQQELRVSLGNDALWQSLLTLQYRGRKMTYAAAYAEAEDSILCEADGTPVGRLLVERKPDCWQIVDVAVLASHRGRGLATWALESCRQQCGEAGAKLALQVKPENPARRLYERLGFRVTGEDALGVEMVWRPGQSREAP